MRKFALVVVLAGLVAGHALAVAPPTAPVVVDTWDEALAASRQYGTPILIDFYTDW